MSKDLAVRELERLKLMAGGEIDQDSSRKKKKKAYQGKNVNTILKTIAWGQILKIIARKRQRHGQIYILENSLGRSE